MGSFFSSNQLAGATTSGVPTVSYAYSTANPAFFGVDATYSVITFPGRVGYVTPFLVQPSAPTITCDSFLHSSPSQSLKCPVTGASLASGRNTISFFAYDSTFTTGADGKTTTFKKSSSPNTLTALGGDITFSIVPPTVTVTVTPTATTTVTSGVSQVPATATNTVPNSVTTVTIYQTTIVSTQTSLSTLQGPSYVTVTASCSPTNTCGAGKATNTLLQCNKDNCLRALIAKSATATSFCASYTKTCGLPTPTYASQCAGLTSRVSSACSCLVTPSAAAARRGQIQFVYAPPDFTFSGTVTQKTVTSFASPTATVTAGTVPSNTVTDPNSTVSAGTSTSTDDEPSTVTVTVFQSTVDGRVASTITVTPASCTSAP